MEINMAHISPIRCMYPEFGIVGCGSDDTGTPGEPAVTTPSTDIPVEVASIAPIDFDTEKVEIQAIYREFYRVFNAYNLHSALVLTHFGIFTTNPCYERIRTG